MVVRAGCGEQKSIRTGPAGQLCTVLEPTARHSYTPGIQLERLAWKTVERRPVGIRIEDRGAHVDKGSQHVRLAEALAPKMPTSGKTLTGRSLPSVRSRATVLGSCSGTGVARCPPPFAAISVAVPRPSSG